jgi:WD40 repeat protein/transcriptional regulator with XRE-family HTH domain
MITSSTEASLGKLLRMYRERAHVSLTQRNLAHLTKVTEKTIQAWEGDISPPTARNLKQLIEVYFSQGLLTVGKELEEAQHLWAMRRAQDHLNTFPVFDEAWFTSLLQSKPPLPLPNSQRREGYASSQTHSKDWGEAIAVPSFYGRDSELAEVEHWLVTDHCRLVVLLGMGGIGKTAFSVKLSRQLEDRFEFLIWRSLKNALPIEDFLVDCILFLSEQVPTALPKSIEGKISLLIELLREHRCLLVLDNIETILQKGNREGFYQEGYEGYGQLLQRIAEADHQSCLVITSREKPKEVGPIEGTNAPVRSLKLAGLELAACQEVLNGKELFGTEDAWAELVRRYSGNPLALKILAETIREVFGGDIAAFLNEGVTLFNGIQALLQQQFERLSEEEKTVMYWLGTARDQVSLEELAGELFPPMARKQTLEVIESLLRRSLIERGTKGAVFSLQPIVLEYVTELMIEQVTAEIITNAPGLLVNHALLKAQSKEYIRQSQVRLILQPLLAGLLAHFQSERSLEGQLLGLLTMRRERPLKEQGYLGGNIINLLVQLRGKLRGYDFSKFTIWQAYLQGIEVQDVNFTESNFRQSVFTDTFDAILSVAFSPDGSYVAAGSTNGEIHIWHVANWQQHVILQAHTDWVRSLVFSPDGRILASGGEDKTVKMWEISSGKCLQTFQGHTSWVWTVTFNSPNGPLLATGELDQNAKIWEANSGECLKTLHGHNGRVYSVAFSPDSSLLASGSSDWTIRLWEVSSGGCLQTFQGHTNRIWSVAFSPDGSLLASGSEDQTVRLWEVSSGRCLAVLQGHTNWIWSVAFSPDGSLLASGSEDQTVRLWEVSSGKCLKVLHGHTDWIGSVAFSPDGARLVAGGPDHSVKVWEVSSGKCLKTLQGDTNWIESLAFNPNSSLLASGSGDQTVRLWEVSSGECLKVLQGHANKVWSVAFSPDGSLLASGSGDQTVKVWRVSTGECLMVLQGYSNRVWSVAFSPDGSLLMTVSSDRIIRLWEVSSGKHLKTLRGHIYRMWSVAFSPDTSLLATGSEDQTVKVWKIATGECLNTLHGHMVNVLQCEQV